MLDIHIKTIPHAQQRYETTGDYWDEFGVVNVRVSDMGNDDYAMLVAIHELVELWLTRRRGIKEADITAFDVAFEANRPAGDESEPGDAPDAPYQNEHNFATAVERMVCAALGVKWADYERAVLAVSE